MPPASDTAATSSGLLHGYMAPQSERDLDPGVLRVRAVEGVAARTR